MKKIPLIILTGPTAVGKTALSIELAKDLNAEIISADSMQIYEYMDIGSAKVTKEEMDGVTHHMIDEVKPDFPFSVSEFQERANKYIKEVANKGKDVLVTGGTGLYLNSLIYNMDFAKSNSNSKIREELEKELKVKGIDYMHDKLKSLDSEAACRIHKNNTKRVIRALEVCLDGKKMQDFSNDLRYNEEYLPIIIVLNRDREILYNRINKRVDIMMESGLIEEVKKLLSMGYDKNLISMQGIGYKEIIKYLEGEYTLDEAVEIIKRDSRRYAKRQITWFKRYKDSEWFDLEKYDNMELLKEDIMNFIENISKNV
ncbi:MAG: tRNA (adenosine(37)-N6)-dimethylallyltransferase MiaA [Terrisporobacter othiniensis]|uniref:tRNA (adenosine(37)-N6)-dimethylallyltransferase MiaA n=1 Tax=Terrisporobacter petrolearius TaxID=1460447 RepID=UPI0022E5B247|nr:tRNA (adenosine(37)-N6)-dimethylallyltransferase MiaA [Terrisporobacter petrolearius]MDU4862257.1 tRNA (adenosine(37)-N6)-dimethylallyltransferase MiaA [Terrisporobacter othiniensis]MDU6993711.1 tRNA (adenosine(37)-N6)-dimethylallyltransferase MiaA [Terrisporobacter othiniensis]